MVFDLLVADRRSSSSIVMDESSLFTTSSTNIFQSNKTKKLLLRLAIWDIYQSVYLTKNSLYSNYTLDEKLIKSKELLIKLFSNQKNYQMKVDIIFPENIEYWENLIIHIRNFENEVGMLPILEMKEIIVPKTSRKIKAYTSTDKGLDTTVDCFSDPFTLASELMIQHKLPPDELDYIHGMIQHEMVDLVRSAVKAQRESLKKIQLKIATVEHLTLLSETICSKYQQLKQSYEAASKKSIKGTPLKTPEKSSQKNEIGGNSSNRTVQHFNKLIIDERRKLDGLEKKILEAKKSLGRLEPHEIFEDSESSKTDDRSADNHRHSNGINESKPSFTPPPRRASVSLRQALATPTGIQQRKPFQAVQEDEDEDDDRRGVFGRVSKTPFSPQPTHSSPYLTRFDSPEEDENTIGLTKHDIDRKLLFKKSEADRLQLIEENRRLRSEITQVTSKIYDRTNEKDISTDNLSYVINELNGWDIERDELDAQIDRLMAQKEELIQKLISTSRGVKYRTKNPQEL